MQEERIEAMIMLLISPGININAREAAVATSTQRTKLVVTLSNIPAQPFPSGDILGSERGASSRVLLEGAVASTPLGHQIGFWR